VKAEERQQIRLAAQKKPPSSNVKSPLVIRKITIKIYASGVAK
jgi:hypothetical protein